MQQSSTSMEKLTSCRVCKSEDTIPFFDLGEQPPANTLLKSPNQKEIFYSLSLSYCAQCGLVQLGETVDPKELFSEYVWVTGTAKTTQEFSKVFFKELADRTESPKKRYVLDVGSNDGTFLIPFLQEGYTVLGVDPAQNIVDIANANNVPTVCRFFGAEVAQEIVQKHGQANMVFARNVLAHVADTRDFVAGLATCLADDGVLAVEVHYAGAIVEELQYDSIYHEHLCYFTLQTLEKLLYDFGLSVFDVIQGPISGGSLIVYAKKEKSERSARLQELEKKEDEQQVNELERWKIFAENCFIHREELGDILKKETSKGAYIVGYGSSARSSTLLNFCKLDSNTIKGIADQNPLKQGLFAAGTHIPIESVEKIMAAKPDIVVILAWNFADEIIDILKETFHYAGRILLPLPNKPYVIEI
jgi:SAM-dependent methyltransferase